MKPCRLFPLLLFLAFPAAGQKQPAKAGAAVSCEQSPLLAQLSRESGAAVLHSYGYSLREPWACTSVESPWAPNSILLHFRKVSAQTDDETAFSVLKVSGIDYIWVVPTDTGMLEVPHAESDPHNIAAFNALLGSFPRAPLSPSDWKEVGKLYMTILGHEEAIPIVPKAGDAAVCTEERECSVAFSGRPVRPGEPFNKWTLVFSEASGAKPAMLEEATRETVPAAASP
jgi:hypothetical protein